MVALKENLGYANLASRSRISKDVHLMTDRTSHMRYLESQLERMNAACSKFSSFDCRLEDMRGQVTMLQDKVINLARMLDAHSHSVVNTAAEIRETATDVSKKQQIVHDLLFGGRSEKGISSNTLSDGCRKFLQAAYDKWASENKCQLTSQVQDVQSSVDNAVQSMFRDVEKASCTYQTKLTETKDHLTERVGDLEHRLDSVAASQLNLCTPVVDSMKKLQDETRQQISMNNSAISHEIASLSQALEQHRLQSRAERCDSNTTLQKLQEQTAQLALAVHRLEQAQLNSPEMHGHTGLMPSIGNYMSKHPLIQHPQPSNTHSPKYERAQAVQTGSQVEQSLAPREVSVPFAVPVSSEKGTMTQSGAPEPPQQNGGTMNTPLHSLEPTGDAQATISAGACTSERQSQHGEVRNQSNAPQAQTASALHTGSTSANGSAHAQPPIAGHHSGSTIPPSGSDQVFIMTPGQPMLPATVAGATGAASNLQPLHLQQQQGVLQHPTAQLVVLSSTGAIQPLTSRMWQQQCLGTAAPTMVPQQAGTKLDKELHHDAAPSQAREARIVPTSQQGTGSKRDNADVCSEKDMQQAHNTLDSSTCPSPSSQRSCPTAANLPFHGSSLSAASLQQSTLWAVSPVQDSDIIWKQPHVLNGSQRQPPNTMLPPRPSHKVAQAGVKSHEAQQRRSSASATTPRLSKIRDIHCVVDSSESDTDSCVDGDGLCSEASGCPSTTAGSQSRSHQQRKGKGTSTVKGTVRSKGKGPRKRTHGTKGKDDGHAAGINGHLSPLLDSSSASSVQQETSDWSLHRQAASVGSPRACRACDTYVHGRGSAPRRTKPQTVQTSSRHTKCTLRQQISRTEGNATSKKTRGPSVAACAPKLVQDGAQSGRQLAHQAYLAAVTGPFAMQSPHYAKPTKAALMRQACDSS